MYLNGGAKTANKLAYANRSGNGATHQTGAVRAAKGVTLTRAVPFTNRSELPIMNMCLQIKRAVCTFDVQIVMVKM